MGMTSGGTGSFSYTEKFWRSLTGAMVLTTSPRVFMSLMAAKSWRMRRSELTGLPPTSCSSSRPSISMSHFW